MPVYKSFGKREPVEDIVEEEEEGEEEEEEGEEAEVELTLPKVPSDWAERLQVTATKPLKQGDWNIDDDALREELFEKQALANVEQAMHLLKAHGIPNKRPSDYYAEMVKSDVHMNKVKENMEYQKARIKSQQQRRQQKHAAKFGKQVQTQVLQERQEAKAQALAKIDHLKKKSKKYGMSAPDSDEVNVAFGGDGTVDEPKKGHGASKRKRSLTPGKSKRPGKNKRHR